MARLESRKKRTVVAGALHKGVNRLPVGADRGDYDLTILVVQYLRLAGGYRSARSGFMKRLTGIIDRQRQHFYAIAMAMDMVGDRAVAAQPGGEDQPNLVLLKDVGGAVPDAGFRPGVGDERKAHAGLIEMRCLFGISDP